MGILKESLVLVNMFPAHLLRALIRRYHCIIVRNMKVPSHGLYVESYD